jgi:hypothetical protein
VAVVQRKGEESKEEEGAEGPNKDTH